MACSTKPEATVESSAHKSETIVSTEKAAPATPENNKEAEAMLRTFYTEYITACVNDTGDATQAIMQKYCTAQLAKKIAGSSLDSDPFLTAQDCFASWIATLTITKAKANNVYNVCFKDESSGHPLCTPVTVIKEGDAYKISYVELMEL